MKKSYYVFLTVIVLLLPVLVAQMINKEKGPKIVSLNTKVGEAKVNPFIKDAIAEFELQLDVLQLISKTPGAAIAIVKDSTIVYLKGIGVKEAGTRDSVDVHTVFRLASVSKPFASFLTGTLVQDSVLHWDDRVSTLLPEFHLSNEEETNKLTLRHVLSHTTGLPFHAYTNLVEEGLPLGELLVRLQSVPLSNKVGKEYSYQNVAYSLVGEAIKSATGKSYEAWMIENVFQPLGMKDASIDYFSMMTNTNIAKPHMPKKGGWRKVSINNTYYNVAPAGGVNASISDMAQWMVALLGNRQDVIAKETLQTMYTPVIEAPSKNRNYGRMHRLRDSFYGLGWRILHYPNDTLVYHGGFVNGYRSEVAVNQRDNIAICILANSPGELPDTGIPIFFSIYQQYRDRIREWEKKNEPRTKPLSNL
jgi:beta-lactamase class C